MVKDHFSLVLPDLTFIEGVEGDDSILNLLYAPIAKGTEHDEKVLSYCYHQARNVANIAEHLGISNSSYLRSKVLNNLVGQGYLLVNKQSRTKYYKTNADAVKLN